MRREKTVVEAAADMSEKKKRQVLNSLMKDQTNMAMSMQREKTRNEEMVWNMISISKVAGIVPLVSDSIL